MEIIDDNTSQILGEKVGTLYVEAYQDVLSEYRKVATGKTIKSISYRITLLPNGVNIKIQADKGLFFIQTGRRKGAKLPVRKTATGFELFPQLQEWVEAVGYTGSHYLLARSISEKGIKGIPITEIVIQQLAQQVNALILQTIGQHAMQNLVREVRGILLE